MNQLDFAVPVFVLIFVGIGFSQAQNQEDPCDNYQVLREEWRAPWSSGPLTQCDNMESGWYAFVLDKQPAAIPTQCLQDNSCGARVPLRVDLGEGGVEPGVGENVTAWLCGSYAVLGAIDCCVQRQPVTIKRCLDSTLIYRLRPQRLCPVAVCAIQVTDTIPELLKAKPGDVPRSVLSPSDFNFTLPDSASTFTSTLFPEICPEGLDMCRDGSCSPCSSTDSPSSTPLVATTSTPQEIIRNLGTVTTTNTPLTSPPTTESTTPVMSSSTLGHTVSSLPPTLPVHSNTSLSQSSSQDTSDSSINGTSDNITSSLSGMSTEPSFDNVTGTSLQDEDLSTDNSTVPDFQPELSSDAGGSNFSSVTDDSLADMTNHTTVSQNTSDSKLPGGMATPETQGSSTDVKTTTILTTSTSGFKTTSKSQTVTMPTSSSSAPVTSRASTVVVTASSTDSASTSPSATATTSVPAVPSSSSARSVVEPVTQTARTGAVRFVIRGPFEEPLFRDTLLSLVRNMSVGGRHVSDLGVYNITLIAETTPNNITVVDVTILDPHTQDMFHPVWLVNAVSIGNFSQLLFSQVGQTLVAVCPSTDRCDEDISYDEDPSTTGQGQQSMSLFDQNRAVFIAVIVVASFCLLALLVGLLLIRYRRQGTWVLAPDHEEKGPDALGIESPMSDHQILHGEGRVSETTLTVNGDHPCTPSDPDQYKDIPAADEDNGWVVPLDQAPRAHGLADKTEDTQF